MYDTKECNLNMPLKLSDAFEVKDRDVKLELLVTMLNINVGHNQKLMTQCKTLRDYSLYVDKVRTYVKKMSLSDAVEKAVDECIQDDILKEFLRSQKSEAIKVTIYEYDQALHEQTLREEGREEGELIKVIEQIQKKTAKNLDIASIAEHLEESVEFVERVCKAIRAKPEATVTELVEYLGTKQ